MSVSYPQHPQTDQPAKPDLTIGRRPKGNGLKVLIWKKKLWFESTFALTTFEPWETAVVCELPCRFTASTLNTIFLIHSRLALK